jgi:hypothetical protein
LGIQKRYLHGLSSTAGGTIGAKKDGVMSAVLAYEFAHRQEYPLDEPYISKRHLLSVWAKYAGLDQDLQCKKVAARCLADIPIKECVEALTVKDATVDDRSLLVDIVLARSTTEAQETINTLATSFFDSDRKVRNFLRSDFLHFPGQFIARAIAQTRNEHPDQYNLLVKILHEHIERDRCTTDEELRALVRYMTQEDGDRARHDHAVAKYFKNLVFPLDQNLLQDCRNTTEQKQRELREKRVSEFIEKFDFLVSSVHFDAEEYESSVLRLLQKDDLLAVVDVDNASLVYGEGFNTTLGDIDHKAESSALTDHSDLVTKWKHRRLQIEEEIQTYIRSNIARLAEQYIQHVLREMLNRHHRPEFFGGKIENVTEAIAQHTHDPLALAWLTAVKAGLKNAWQDIQAQEQKRVDAEKKEMLEYIPAEYLKKLIELRTGYLKELYEAGLGLTLPNVAIHGIHERGSTVGSVWGGGGGGLGMRLEQRLSLELSVEGALHLEIGETLDDMLHREAMVDWVGPHEIAHLVDEERNYTNICTSGETAEKLQQFIGTNDAPFAANVAQEVVIDTLGYAMVKQFGSSDPRDREPRDRIAKAVQGFLVMCEMSRDIIERSSDGDKKAYLIQTLRLIAVGEVLEEDAKSHTVRGNILDELRGELRLLESLILRHQRAAMLFARPQQKEFIKLCKEFFAKIKIEE